MSPRGVPADEAENAGAVKVGKFPFVALGRASANAEHRRFSSKSVNRRRDRKEVLGIHGRGHAPPTSSAEAARPSIWARWAAISSLNDSTPTTTLPEAALGAARRPWASDPYSER